MGEAGQPEIIGAGDDSFEEFVGASSARLFTMARLLTAGHRAEAEDLLQGAFERAYRHWGRISRRGDPERYVRQILVSAPADRWRRLRRHPEAPSEITPAGPAAAGASAGIADRDVLLRGLAELPPRQRAVPGAALLRRSLRGTGGDGARLQRGDGAEPVHARARLAAGEHRPGQRPG